MNRRSNAALRLEPRQAEWPRRLAFHLVRWAPLVILAVGTYLLFPGAGRTSVPVLEEGQVAPEDVLAPFAFLVRKSPAELERERSALAATARSIWEWRPGVVDSVRTAATALFDGLAGASGAAALADSAARRGVRLAPDEAAFLAERGRVAAYREAVLRVVDGPLARGVAGDELVREPGREIVRRRQGVERVIPRDSVMTFAGLLAARTAWHPAPNSSAGDQAFVKILNSLFRPTLVLNVAETEQARAELRASVDTVKDEVRATERIIAAHEVVTAESRDRLLALRGELVRRGAEQGTPLPTVAGRILGNVLVLAIFWLLLMLYRRETYRELRQIFVVAAILGIVLIGAAANALYITPAPALVPIPFAAMLLTVLFSGRVAMLAAAVLAILLAAQAPFASEEALLLVLVGGVAGAIGIRVVRRRTQLLATMGVVIAAYVLVAVTVALQYGWAAAELGSTIAIGAVNAMVSTALVGFTLPVFESLARVTTDLTLLELADPTRPLLRRLATEAPGTYAHSVSMANLCEAACDAIGANGLLARVGCYYHDVGKVRKPHFFVENQAPGANPHDKLKPEVSAAIIRNHVKDGIALAEESGLPPSVVAFIPEHHGTADISYFLERARRENTEVPPEQFRYPGPKPRSVETAVAMLADGVEAAIRVLDDPSQDNVREAIHHLVRARVESGQLNDAPLTLAQLERVRDEFTRVLGGMYHTRIDYPTAGGGLSADWQGEQRA